MSGEFPQGAKPSEFDRSNLLEGFPLSIGDRQRIEREEPVVVVSRDYVGVSPDRKLVRREYPLKAGDFVEISTTKGGSGTGYHRQGILISGTENGVRMIEVLGKQRQMVRIATLGIKNVSKIEK